MSSQQVWNPKQYAEHARFVTELGAPLIALLVPKAGERILDMGCGDGVLTKQLMDIGCEVLGVDASPAMVEAARTLGVQAQVMDGHALPFHEQFNAVFSNAALHWMLELGRGPTQDLVGVATGRAFRGGIRRAGQSDSRVDRAPSGPQDSRI